MKRGWVAISLMHYTDEDGEVTTNTEPKFGRRVNHG
jgi:hypothetical protein